LLEALFLAAVALHFGNYFYAAVGKGIVGDNPLHWIYGNRTEFLLLVSQEAGVNPRSFSQSLLRGAYEVFSQTYWFFNLVTIVGQFVCVVTIVRVRWAIWTTVFYDLMHLSIFVLTGIFFWKYILLNFAIIMGLRTLVRRRIHAAFAIDRNGVEYRVPSSFFLNVSMTMNQQRLIYPSVGSLPTSTRGTTNDTDVMRKAMACTLERIDEGMSANKYYKPKEEIISAVLNHHRVTLAKTDENGKVGFDLYPHHMFSFPWQETEFRKFDLRDIAGYKYPLEALCLGVDDTSFTRKVLWRNEFRFDIPKS
jgi:hypothetical protein